MDPACLRHTELPHTSRLFIDFLYHYHRVERFYTAPPATGYPEERRQALVEALAAQNSDQAALRKLAQPGALAVVTGQQVGLFTGPAYTIYKALTAARLAADLTSRGYTAVPVFWLATEDHDWQEVDHTWLYGSSHQPVMVRAQADRNGGVPVGSVCPPEWPVEALASQLQGLPYAGDVLELVHNAYQPRRTMGQAFRAALESLLRPYGFLFLDPLHPAIRTLAAPILQKAVSIAPELNAALLQRNRELEAAGYHAQVHVDARTSLFFLLEGGRRLPIRDLKYTPEQLAARAADLSPNALFRPVVQDYMLPTAAYIGGPAEIAYFAQSQVLYERLLGHMPRVMSRNGFTLIDSRSAKLLDKYKLRLQDFFQGEELLRERVASTLVPKDLQEDFDGTVKSVTSSVDRLQRSVGRFDPTLKAALEKSRTKMLYQLSKTRGKVARRILQRNEQATADASYLYGSVYPQKHLQERLYSILPFLAQHGPGLINDLYEHVHLDCPDHVLLPV